MRLPSTALRQGCVGRHSLSALPQLSLPDEVTPHPPFLLGVVLCCPPACPHSCLLSLTRVNVLGSRDSTMHTGTMSTVSPRAWRAPPFSYSSVASQSGERPWLRAPSTPQSPQSAVSSYTVTAAISSANQVEGSRSQEIMEMCEI